VQRVGNNVNTMSANTSPVSGSLSLPNSVNGQNHTLYFDIHNYYDYSGGAVKGILNIKGHLGGCER